MLTPFLLRALLAFSAIPTMAADVAEGEARVYEWPETVLHVGENFAEMPRDPHGVGANASGVERSKLLAVFFADAADNKLATSDHPQGAHCTLGA